MSKYFKNKISYNHVLLLSIIAAYFLFLLCFYYASRGIKQQVDNNNESYIVTLKSGISSQDLSQLDAYINAQNSLINKSTRINGDDVFNYFEVSKTFLSDDEFEVGNIFSHHYVLELDNDDDNKNSLIDSLETMSGIADLFKVESATNNSTVKANTTYDFSTLSMIVILILILSLIYIGLSLDFQRNQDKLKAILMKGATQKYLMSNYQKKGLILSIKTWLGGLVLFFLSFYLLRFNTYSDLSIFEFKFFGIVCLVPLALIIFITSFVIYRKIMTLIRE